MIGYIVGAIVLVIVAVVLFCWYENNAIQTEQHTFSSPQTMSIVHISDLHGKAFGKGNQKLLKKIMDCHPDVICITGDIIHKYRKKDIDIALQFCRSCAAICPTLYVAGNHEMRNKQYRSLRAQIQATGVLVLDNTRCSQQGIDFVGINCADLKNKTLHAITPNVDYKILLAHEPQFFEKYVEESYNLVLCGHAHGGQFRIPFTGQGIYSPGQGLFPKYTAGCHSKDKTNMVVSRGLGNSQCPLRLCNRPNLIHIVLQKK